MTTTVRFVVAAWMLVLTVGSAGSQPVAVERAQSGAGASPSPAAPPPSVSYDPQGRRDPFVSLLSRGADPKARGKASTPAGLIVSEVIVKGIVRDRSGFLAMIRGADSKTFIVRPGEKLLDGSIKAILSDSVVFTQDVTDPLSTVKQKEVRKAVRPADGGRGEPGA